MFDFISVTESVHLFHTCSISTEIASHTVWNHVRKHRRVPLGQKHNTGISSLWAQLEKGQREQWANCVPVGALQGNYVPAIHKGGRIISRKQVSLPPTPSTWSNLLETKGTLSLWCTGKEVWQLQRSRWHGQTEVPVWGCKKKQKNRKWNSQIKFSSER